MGVPFLPGVPPLASYSPLGSIILLTADALLGFIGLFGPNWGIFFDGIPVVVADSVVSFEYRQDWTISDYPQEQGSFETYDKVALPFIARVRFAQGGSAADRQALLDSVAAIAGDTNLYTVVTPEEVYQNVNITHYDYRRTSTQGVGLITVDVWLVEVRVTATVDFANTLSPSGSDPQSGGTSNPGPPSDSQQASVSNQLPSGTPL